MDRAGSSVKRLDALFEAMRRNGQLAEFNRQYKRERTSAHINADGSIGQWKLCPFHLKGGRSAPGTAVANGILYVTGGRGDLLLEDVFNDIQYAPIRDDGCPDAWHTNAARLNMSFYGHTTALTSITGTPSLVVLGGNAGQGNYFNNVQFAPLEADGETKWFPFDTHQFSVPRGGHATVRYNDFIYVLGGAQRGDGGYVNDVPPGWRTGRIDK